MPIPISERFPAIFREYMDEIHLVIHELYDFLILYIKPQMVKSDIFYTTICNDEYIIYG